MNPEETIFDGEILPPELCAFINRRKLEMEFDELAKIYGRAQATEIWNEVTKEHSDAALS